ncbi:integumentary mucin C.1-like [Dendronephthya gigantea]|uniref:integumentary mucin C.1-like n=1 Tax=Dendronephthya gigantea TaxID=151771 RepID=UPI00106AC188|nr:integumentary mucin C.1-like [Dendronephthya gigantea]
MLKTFLIVAALCCVSTSMDDTSCSCVHPNYRVDCGYDGIRWRECVLNGCCWDDSIKDTKWCFYPAGNCCSSVHPKQRVNCGSYKEKDCVKKGCCWDETIIGVYRCFYPAGHNCLCVRPKDRKECGYLGIKEDECAKKGCCWDSSIKDAKWCFYSIFVVAAVLCCVLINTRQVDAGPRETAGPGCSAVFPQSRVDCGYHGVTAEECAKKGCCWDDTIWAFPWCFYPLE